MRKVVFMVCLFFLVSTIGYSQKSFGVKAGLNVTRLNVNEAYTLKIKNRVGYHLGIWKESTISPKVFLRTELFYTLKGGRYSDTLTLPFANEASRTKGTLIYNYFTLPLLLGYQLKSKTAVFLGPEFSLLIAPRNRDDGGRTHNMKNILRYNAPDIGLTAGFRYNLNAKLSADLRYTYGFSTILQYEATDVQGNAYSPKQSHNEAAQLGLSYTLKTKNGKS
ncbi:porin family protein [Adhaeribacter radiodurans]|uniref:PorT family protein n=1 Tax=Adhaeribacter radiodurans TaxID=2745197 RepID=A0A7L7L3B1_9BACT|nr:porin family protein [Adhaeribacter radiodurans]QMU26919.1 PorT family protein [Adhaeribacter radiodurans]